MASLATDAHEQQQQQQRHKTNSHRRTWTSKCVIKSTATKGKANKNHKLCTRSVFITRFCVFLVNSLRFNKNDVLANWCSVQTYFYIVKGSSPTAAILQFSAIVEWRIIIHILSRSSLIPHLATLATRGHLEHGPDAWTYFSRGSSGTLRRHSTMSPKFTIGMPGKYFNRDSHPKLIILGQSNQTKQTKLILTARDASAERHGTFIIGGRTEVIHQGTGS